MESVGKTNELLKHYVSALESQGFYDITSVEQLLIYCFIVDTILEGPLGFYLTDKDLAIVNRFLRCLSKSNCLIPAVAQFDRLSVPRFGHYSGQLRTTETEAMRDTENNDLRTAERGR